MLEGINVFIAAERENLLWAIRGALMYVNP